MEHNSVLRPLASLQKRGVEVTIVEADANGYVASQSVAEAIRPNTKLIEVMHASNVVGTIMPIAEIGKVAREHGILFMVDGAQTAGVLPVDMEKYFIDVLCIPGHKGLMGPAGTGALLVKKGVDIEPFIEGGTGSLSQSVEQPPFMPDRLESGTQNVPGIAGLKAGLEYINSVGLETILQRERGLTEMFLDGLQELHGITIYGPNDSSNMVGVISLTIDGMDPSQISNVLDQEYGIATRPGLQCAPLAHKSIGTFPTGTVRFSIGWFNSREDIAITLDALKKITRR
jgi:cysteine desulfurase family protein